MKKKNKEDESMTWKDILKAPPLTPEEEKQVQDLMRFRNMMREKAEKIVRRKTGKGARQRSSVGRMVKQDIKAKILAEIKKEGGALGMKNLKQFGEEAEIKRALAELEKDGKVFMHKDGDIYTHNPK
jgi:hypothetical protein